MAMEGMEDREATFLEGLEDQGTATLAMAVAVMDRTEAAMAAMDMVLVALEVVVEAEARQAPHLLVAGRPMRTGTVGQATGRTVVFMNSPRFSTRKSRKGPNINTPVYLVALHGGRKCGTTSSGDAGTAFTS